MSTRKASSPRVSSERSAAIPIVSSRGGDKWILESELPGYFESVGDEGTEWGRAGSKRTDYDHLDGRRKGEHHSTNKRYRSSMSLSANGGLSYIHYCPTGRKPFVLLDGLTDEQSAEAADTKRKKLPMSSAQNGVPLKSSGRSGPSSIASTSSSSSTDSQSTNGVNMVSASPFSERSNTVAMEPDVTRLFSVHKHSAKSCALPRSEMAATSASPFSTLLQPDSSNECSPFLANWHPVPPRSGSRLPRTHAKLASAFELETTRADDTYNHNYRPSAGYQKTGSNYLPSVRDLIEEVDALHPALSSPERASPGSPASQLPSNLHRFMRHGPLSAASALPGLPNPESGIRDASLSRQHAILPTPVGPSRCPISVTQQVSQPRWL